MHPRMHTLPLPRSLAPRTQLRVRQRVTDGILAENTPPSPLRRNSCSGRNKRHTHRNPHQGRFVFMEKKWTVSMIAMYIEEAHQALGWGVEEWHIQRILDSIDGMDFTGPNGNPVAPSAYFALQDRNGHRIGSLPTTPVSARFGRPRSSHAVPPPIYSAVPSGAQIEMPLSMLERQAWSPPPSYMRATDTPRQDETSGSENPHSEANHLLEAADQNFNPSDSDVTQARYVLDLPMPPVGDLPLQPLRRRGAGHRRPAYPIPLPIMIPSHSEGMRALARMLEPTLQDSDDPMDASPITAQADFIPFEPPSPGTQSESAVNWTRNSPMDLVESSDESSDTSSDTSSDAELDDPQFPLMINRRRQNEARAHRQRQRDQQRVRTYRHRRPVQVQETSSPEVSSSPRTILRARSRRRTPQDSSFSRGSASWSSSSSPPMHSARASSLGSLEDYIDEDMLELEVPGPASEANSPRDE